MIKKIVCLFAAIILFTGVARANGEKPVINVITVASVITTPTAKYVADSIEKAKEEGAQGLIILLDTPGGMDTTMREIAKSLLNSPIPVIVYVYPSGARAASAGVIITTAAHVAAMAPGTNIGAAHPVAIGLGGSGGVDK
ncbi:MAG TPA: nodulation protein NfeD, partial [Deltaproteobacteria bacterium]|nr:nodulation protein NfeD [Deltaproteobacteria bacterium]